MEHVPPIDERTARVFPSPEQLAWQRSGLGVFFHVGTNTFTDLEWGDGTADPNVFNPTALDIDQWLEAATSIGARYAILTAKHHDGFCLWPTATTNYSVASSSWREGRGDVVGEFVAACRRAGVLPGLYLSPWDRHDPRYPDPAAYDDVYCAQLTELCTNYGELGELWFDGAGSDGRAYDWARIAEICRRLQPGAMRFNEGDYTIRWIGNEDGYAADPVRYVVDATPLARYRTGRSTGGELRYAPPEVDVSIRPGWFFHEYEEPHSLEHLLDIHDHSVGLGATLLLNLPPDPSGRIASVDVARCREFGAALRERYDRPVQATVSTLGEGRWCASFPTRLTIGRLELAEDLTQGQRVIGHRVLAGQDVVAEGQTIGVRRIHRLVTPRPVDSLDVVLDGPAPTLTSVVAYPAGAD